MPRIDHRDDREAADGLGVGCVVSLEEVRQVGRTYRGRRDVHLPGALLQVRLHHDRRGHGVGDQPSVIGDVRPGLSLGDQLHL